MELYLIRHAEALPVGHDGVADDDRRPLTEAGRAHVRGVAEALQRLSVRFDKVVTSPLVRARQTADLLAELGPAPAPEVVECNALRPEGKRRKLNRFLLSLGAESVAVVGHNPDLSRFLAWLIGGKDVQVQLAKAGVARLELEGGLDKGAALLTWMVTPEWCGALQPARP
jgi:phosphohistidine phosphatase